MNGLGGEEEMIKVFLEVIFGQIKETLRRAQVDINKRNDRVDTFAGHIGEILALRRS